MPLLTESIAYIDSHRDQHFTDALVQNASEYENIALGGLSSGTQATTQTTPQPGRFHIVSVRMTTATRHDFMLTFFSRPGGYQALAATPYTGSLIGRISLPAGCAYQLHSTASEYIYATDFSSIHYMDEDGSGTLHVGLHNLSTSTKAALGSSNLPSGVSQQYIQMRFGVIAAS